MRGVILEGVTAAGKTRLLGHLQRLLADRSSNTKVVISEHYTERMLEHRWEAGTLSEDEVLVHLNEVLDVLEPFRRAKSVSKFAGRGGNTTVLVVLERFLLGFFPTLRLLDPRRWELTPRLTADIAKLYERAESYGLRRVVLRIEPAAMRDRVLSTKAHRNQAWGDYLSKIGDEAAIVDHFIRWQDILLETCRTLEDIIQPTFIDVGMGWDDDRYRTVAETVYRDCLKG
jgi:hypothetical protein